MKKAFRLLPSSNVQAKFIGINWLLKHDAFPSFSSERAKRMKQTSGGVRRGGKFLSKRLGIDSLLHILIKFETETQRAPAGCGVQTNFRDAFWLEDVEQILVSVSARVRRKSHRLGECGCALGAGFYRTRLLQVHGSESGKFHVWSNASARITCSAEWSSTGKWEKFCCLRISIFHQVSASLDRKITTGCCLGCSGTSLDRSKASSSSWAITTLALTPSAPSSLCSPSKSIPVWWCYRFSRNSNQGLSFADSRGLKHDRKRLCLGRK